MNTVLIAAQPACDNMRKKLEKKFPNAWAISVTPMFDGPYGRVETDNQMLDFTFTKAGHLRLSYTRILNPTEKSIRLQPFDSVIQITGDGPYRGLYILRHTGDGWYDTTASIEEAKPMRRSDANSSRGHIAFNAQHCYGSKFEVVTIPAKTN